MSVRYKISKRDELHFVTFQMVKMDRRFHVESLSENCYRRVNNVIMKAYIFVFLYSMNILVTQAQEEYQSFIKEFTNVYDKKKKTFQRESQKAMQDYLHSNRDNTKNQQNRYDFLFIPELLLKKSKKLYENIDSTNLVQYFDPKSMFYHLTLVSSNSLYIGEIRGWYPEVGKNQFSPKPENGNFIFERLYKQLTDINPDMVFTVQNVGEFFFIKENCLYVLEREKRDGDFMIYTIDEYTKIYRDNIFDVFFRYEPRLKPIISY